MGTQYLGMGTALYRQYPALRDALDAADRVLTPLTGVPLGALMRGECTGTERLNEALYAQPRPVRLRIGHEAALAVLGSPPVGADRPQPRRAFSSTANECRPLSRSRAAVPRPDMRAPMMSTSWSSTTDPPSGMFFDGPLWAVVLTQG
ncbi:hypothetical protein AQJ11_41165 [Streptomyces corchorusii]|uniref:Malonyl-CoA:ACP transacylase (MAT) domain-containing protein n=1 Tax=Streptomyces corchorusii TaxID=1903 RepID=A0A117Q9I1_STRCK|nr:hypothetical protein AQJ11_41165 [Streptomyces corchorusii]